MRGVSICTNGHALSRRALTKEHYSLLKYRFGDRHLVLCLRYRIIDGVSVGVVVRDWRYWQQLWEGLKKNATRCSLTWLDDI